MTRLNSEAPFASDDRYLLASLLIGHKYMRICFKLSSVVLSTNRQSCVFLANRVYGQSEAMIYCSVVLIFSTPRPIHCSMDLFNNKLHPSFLTAIPILNFSSLRDTSL